MLVDVEFAAATLSELIERVDRGTRLGRILVKNMNNILEQEINEFSMNGILPGGKGTPGSAAAATGGISTVQLGQCSG